MTSIRLSLRHAAIAAQDAGRLFTLDPRVLVELIDRLMALEVERLRREIDRVKAALPAVSVIHALRGGETLCGTMKGAPCDWPRGHTWVGPDMGRKLVNCLGCRAALAREART